MWSRLNTFFHVFIYLPKPTKKLNDTITAVDYYERAIGLPSCFQTAKAHYGLGLILKDNGNATRDVEEQFEMALNVGMDVTVSSCLVHLTLILVHYVNCYVSFLFSLRY